MKRKGSMMSVKDVVKMMMAQPQLSRPGPSTLCSQRRAR